MMGSPIFYACPFKPYTNQRAAAMGMIARSRLMQSALFSAAASGCRRVSSSSSCFSSSIKNNNKNNDHLFLVSRYTRETNLHYLSLVSTENWTTVRDFHSPHFCCFESFSVQGLGALTHLSERRTCLESIDERVQAPSSLLHPTPTQQNLLHNLY